MVCKRGLTWFVRSWLAQGVDVIRKRGLTWFCKRVLTWFVRSWIAQGIDVVCKQVASTGD